MNKNNTKMLKKKIILELEDAYKQYKPKFDLEFVNEQNIKVCLVYTNTKEILTIDKFPQASKTFCELLDNVKDKNHISCYGEYYKEL